MQQQATRHLAQALFLTAALAALAGCKTNPPAPPDLNAAPQTSVTIGPIKVPGGMDASRAKMIAEMRKPKIYTVLLGISDPSNEKLLFSRAMDQALGLTNAQLQRRFIDTVSKGNRFEMYDNTSTVTAEATDLLVDGQFTSATQEIQTIEGGVRVSVTRVRLSLQMKDRYTGKLLFPRAVEVVGQTGRSTGDRVVIAPGESLSDPAVQTRLAHDYETAMQRAFDEAAQRIQDVLRPMGKVFDASGDQVAITGGLTHGFQGGDNLVIFRANIIKIGGQDAFGLVHPIAAVRCDAVGDQQSQCTVIRKQDANAQPQAGDYAVLADFSARGPREY